MTAYKKRFFTLIGLQLTVLPIGVNRGNRGQLSNLVKF